MYQWGAVWTCNLAAEMVGEIWQGKCGKLFASVPGSADKTN